MKTSVTNVKKTNRRREDAPLISGSGKFIDDIKPAGLLHMGLLRSTYPRAGIKVNVNDSLSVPGVVVAYSGEDIARKYPFGFYGVIKDKNPSTKSANCYCLATDEVRFVGEPIAVVVGHDKSAVRDGLDQILVSYDPKDHVVDAERAIRPSAPLLYEEWGDNIQLRWALSSGDIKRSFDDAPYKFKEVLQVNRHSASPIETRGCLASWDNASGTLTVWLTSQTPHLRRAELAAILGLNESKVQLLALPVGGAFGSKMFVHGEDLLACILSMKLGRPVKYMEDRRENLISWGGARDQVHEIEVACSKEGAIVALKDRIVADLGAYAPGSGPNIAMVTALFVPGTYKIRNYQFEVFGIVTNKSTTGAYRGFGKESANFAIERMMDIVARRLGLDPAEIRKINYIRPEEFPYQSPTNVVYDSGDYAKSLDLALKMIDYKKVRAEQRRLRKNGRYVGIGLASALCPAGIRLSFINTDYESATIKLERSGKITVLISSMSIGTGHESSVSRLVSNEMGVSEADVAVVEGDTKVCPQGFGAVSDRFSVMVAPAVISAVRLLKENILKISSKILGVPVDRVEIKGSKIVTKDGQIRSITLAEIAEFARRNNLAATLEHTSIFRPPNSANDPVFGGNNVYSSYPYAIVVSVVEVDIETGQVNVKRILLVDDCGEMINPTLVDGQLQGAAVQGLGGALLEELRYDSDGQPIVTSFVDYLIPTAMEIPRIDIGHTITPSPYIPGGFKGAAETGIVGIYSSIANAVEDALSPMNIVVTETPIKPELLLRKIRLGMHDNPARASVL